MDLSNKFETRRSATLWMGDVEPYMDDNFLVHAFKEALDRPDNIVREIKTPLNKLTGLPVGYCFVEFIDQHEAFKVLHRLGGKPIPNSNPMKRFKLNTVGHRGGENPTEWSIWVGDLDITHVDDEVLFKFFSDKFPSTTAARVVCDKATRLSRGFAFVRFSDQTEQQKAMIELNNIELKGRRIKIRAAQPRTTQYNNFGNQSHQTYGDVSYQQTMNQGQWYKPRATTQYTPELEEQDTLVEPVLIDEVTTLNKDFVSMSGEVYEALEQCRWYGHIHPISIGDNQLTTHFVK